MKRILKWLVVLVIVIAAALAGASVWLNSYLKTPEFKQRVLTAAREAVGTDVKIDAIDISLLSGVQLKKIVIGNPPGFSGDALRADAIVLQYSLWPLLERRVEIEQLSASKPVVTLVRNEKGDWNYNSFGSTKTGTAAPKPATETKTAAPASSNAPALDIALSRLAIEDGEVSILGEKGKPLCRLQGLDLSTSVDFADGKIRGGGRTGMDTLSVADALFARNIKAPVAIAASDVKLAPLSGKLASGNLGGDITVRLAEGFKYLVNIQLNNGDMDKLLQEAGSSRVMTGRLQINTALEGTGGLPTMNGKGQMLVTDGKLSQLPLQSLLATLLQVSELREFKFDQCVVEFTLANNTLQTPVIKITSPTIQVTGKGSVSLADYTLNHELTLALSKTLLGKAPKELQSVFAERSDGFLTMDFHVTGPYSSPKTDILKSIATKGIQQQLKKFLK